MSHQRGSANIVAFISPARKAEKKSDDCKRASPRRRVLKGALACFCNRHCTIPCTVRDISATGARLKCDGSLAIPDTFELVIELDGLEVSCEVVWRKGSELGVRFIGAARKLEPRRQQVIKTATSQSVTSPIQSKPLQRPASQVPVPVVADAGARKRG